MHGLVSVLLFVTETDSTVLAALMVLLFAESTMSTMFVAADVSMVSTTEMRFFVLTTTMSTVNVAMFGAISMGVGSGDGNQGEKGDELEKGKLISKLVSFS